MADARILELALIGLQTEKEKIDGEIARIQGQLGRGRSRGVAMAAGGSGRRRGRRRRNFTEAARRAQSLRMKAYWRKRKAAKSKTSKWL